MNTYDDTTPAERAGRHPLSAGYLVAGLVFLGIATTWALRAADVIDDDGSRWVLPVVLIVAGLAGLAASVTRSARGRQERVAEEDATYTVPGFHEPVEPDPDDQGSDPLAR